MSNKKHIKTGSLVINNTREGISKATEQDEETNETAMAASIYLPGHLREILAPLAARQGISVETYAAQVLKEAANRKGNQ